MSTKLTAAVSRLYFNLTFSAASFVPLESRVFVGKMVLRCFVGAQNRSLKVAVLMRQRRCWQNTDCLLGQ